MLSITGLGSAGDISGSTCRSRVIEHPNPKFDCWYRVGLSMVHLHMWRILYVGLQNHRLPVLSAMFLANWSTKWHLEHSFRRRRRYTLHTSNRSIWWIGRSIYRLVAVLKPFSPSLLCSMHPPRVQYYYHLNFPITSNFHIKLLLTI